MSCGCKKKPVHEDVTNKLITKIDKKSGLIGRILFFILLISIIPLLYPVMVVILFNQYVLNKNFELSKMFKFNKNNKENEEYEDIDTINSEDYELVGVDTLKTIENE